MKSILFILFFLPGAIVFAQGPDNSFKRNSFELLTGINQIKEENIHPKVHSGLITGITYQHFLKSKWYSDFALTLKWSRVKTDYEDLPASANLTITGDYRYLFKIFDNPKLSYGLGPEVNAQYNLSLYPNWDESHLYWANHIDLGAENLLILRVSESGRLQFDLGFSVFSLFNQPEYNRMFKMDDSSLGNIIHELHSDFEAGSINKAIRLAFSFEYQFLLHSKVTEALCYSYDYLKLNGNQSLPFQNNIHQLGFKIYFK